MRTVESVHLPGLGTTMVVCPKNASSSILWALHHKSAHKRRIVRCDAVPTRTALFLWRDPIERAWSAYRYLQDWCPERSSAWWPDPKQPWEAFANELAENWDHIDLHGALRGQWEYRNTRGVEYELIEWDFSQLQERLGVAIGRDNVGPSMPRPSTPDVLYDIYAPDLSANANTH